MKKKGRLGVVEWIDAASYTNFTLEDVYDADLLVQCFSVGYIIKRKKDVVVVYTIQGEHCDFICIPLNWVKKITYLYDVQKTQ
jgi:hypothetical protein